MIDMTGSYFRVIFKWLFLLTLLLFAAVQSASADEIIPNDPLFLNGVWQTEGYGYLVEIEGGNVTLYEKTLISCLKSALKVGPLQSHASSKVDAQFHVSIPGFIDTAIKVMVEG